MSKESIELVKRLYKDDYGKPFEMTPIQAEIFDLIFKRKYPRNQVMTYTQFGKSSIVAMAVLTRAATFAEKWPIVAPDTNRARNLISYVIQHIFDNPYTLSRFEIKPDESLERIRRERSKNRLTFKVEGGIGEIYILSGQAKFKGEDAGNALMGYGAPNLILEEASLIPDKVYGKALRMLGGFKDNFLIKIGNPFYRNHFLESWRSDEYKKIVVDWKLGVKEGRTTKEFVEEARRSMDEIMFRILYECKFPPEESIDSSGYSPLISEKKLDLAYQDKVQLWGELRLGIDVAGSGGNESVIVLRGENGAKVLFRGNLSDTMALVGKVLEFKKVFNVLRENVFIDVVGVGKGVYDRLKEELGEVSGVNFGNKPEFDEDFVNLRAQSYWRVKRAIETGFVLEKNNGWEQLLRIKYKVQSDRKIKIKSKDEMLKEGILSPDVADALALTFARQSKVLVRKKYVQKPYEPISEYEGR